MPGVRGLSSPRAQLAGLISQAIFYGGNVLLSSIAVFLLETSKSRDRVTVWLSCFLLVMFGLSTAYLAILSHYIVEGSLSDASVVTASTPTGDRVSVWLTILLEDIICLLGDLIIIWRAWILWNRKHIYLIPPMILWLASLVAAVFETRANAIATHPDYAFVQRQGSSIWGIAFIMLTFSTNLTAALMVGWKYKSHRKDAAPYLMHRSRNNYILTLVVESGALYCITWIIKIIVWTSTTNGIYVLLPIITQLTTIYPTMVIVLVSLRLSYGDNPEVFQRSAASHRPKAERMMGIVGSIEDHTALPSQSFELVGDLKQQEETPTPTVTDDAPYHVVQLTTRSSMAFRSPQVNDVAYQSPRSVETEFPITHEG